ncbi:MAG: CpsD/CapB family tyrosine-protein kinase [Candidatus Omnitrophica bacterium]|nr:CpsD/CapB family tyrosine-protein kinase [Candidatus Omnitrophota bacterium]MDD5429299.1 CpsD/CapB family tyrosine-protein kinase [Candidatus Omnitrophota bacterium]
MDKRKDIFSSFNKRVVVNLDPRSPEAESYRSIRTNILSSNLKNPPKVLLLTSAHPEEGKSLTSTNLAIVMAEIGKKTLLVDCDLRRPSVHGILGMDKAQGLSEVLYGTLEWDKVLKNTGVDNLHVITSGAIPHNPSEIIGSDKMKLFLEEVKNVFDIVILDVPCILAVTDSIILSLLADIIFMVVMAEKTPREAVLRAMSMLYDVKSDVAGIIFNKVNMRRSHYYYYYYYGSKTRKES